MSEDQSLMPTPEGVRHYYGDIVRILFVVAAALILAAQVIGSAFLTPGASLLSAIVLVVAAGLTNPVQMWIHWTNIFLAGLGLLVAGGVFLNRFNSGESIAQGFIVMTLSVVFILALYFATRTLRGMMMRDVPEIQ